MRTFETGPRGTCKMFGTFSTDAITQALILSEANLWLSESGVAPVQLLSSACSFFVFF
jgi:hypothetical protein